MTTRQKVTGIITGLMIAAALLTFFANRSIRLESQKYITYDISQLPEMKTGVLLGTSRALKNGRKNDFFYHRIEATTELYKKGKIKYIIVSGDNSTRNYNEPLDMKAALMENGIPDSVIFPDYAGFRTFDSMIRAKEVFGQKEFIIISQQFHNERAVFIARKNDITAFGYSAREVAAFQGFRTRIREYFARDKVYIDMLFGVTPKFLGERVEIK